MIMFSSSAQWNFCFKVLKLLHLLYMVGVCCSPYLYSIINYTLTNVWMAIIFVVLLKLSLILFYVWYSAKNFCTCFINISIKSHLGIKIYSGVFKRTAGKHVCFVIRNSSILIHQDLYLIQLLIVFQGTVPQFFIPHKRKQHVLTIDDSISKMDLMAQSVVSDKSMLNNTPGKLVHCMGNSYI